MGDPEDVGTQRDESGDADYADCAGFADYAADGPLGLCTRYQLRAPLAARPQWQQQESGTRRRGGWQKIAPGVLSRER